MPLVNVVAYMTLEDRLARRSSCKIWTHNTEKAVGSLRLLSNRAIILARWRAPGADFSMLRFGSDILVYLRLETGALTLRLTGLGCNSRKRPPGRPMGNGSPSHSNREGDNNIYMYCAQMGADRQPRHGAPKPATGNPPGRPDSAVNRLHLESRRRLGHLIPTQPVHARAVDQLTDAWRARYLARLVARWPKRIVFASRRGLALHRYHLLELETGASRRRLVVEYRATIACRSGRRTGRAVSLSPAQSMRVSRIMRVDVATGDVSTAGVRRGRMPIRWPGARGS